MIFVLPFIAIGLGFLLILLIKQSSPAVAFERMGSDEKLDPDERALTMSEEEFRIFVIDLFAERGYEPSRL